MRDGHILIDIGLLSAGSISNGSTSCKNWGFYFEYDGDLINLFALRQISQGKLNPEAVSDLAEKYRRDLARDSFFEKISDQGQGRFNVLYTRKGNIHQQKSLYFVRRNGWIMRIARIAPDIVQIQGNQLSKDADSLLKTHGLRAAGTVWLWTDAKALEHNATAVEQQQGLDLYRWDITALTENSPKFSCNCPNFSRNQAKLWDIQGMGA